MSIVYRRPGEDDHSAMVRTFYDVMNTPITDERIAELKEHDELDRSWVADDGGKIVGTITGHSFNFTLPGGTTAPLAGLTLVSVIPSHRRRGILHELMARFDGDCRDRGESFSGLFATEAAIYGRYGFGAATRFASLSIERDRAAGLADVDIPGAIRWGRFVDVAEEVFDLFEKTRPSRVGEIVRPRHTLDAMVRRVEKAEKPVFAAIHDGPGGPDGYALYRIESKWTDHTAQNEVRIAELTGAGLVRVALWRFLLELDLVRTVTDGNARVDEPVHDVLRDERQLRVTGVYDQLQLRVMDPAGALSTRAYNMDGRVRIGVDGTTYDLTVDDGKPSVSVTTDAADIDISPRGLAMTYLGGRPFRSLLQSGLARAEPRAAVLADAMFSTSPAPQCLTQF